MSQAQPVTETCPMAKKPLVYVRLAKMVTNPAEMEAIWKSHTSNGGTMSYSQIEATFCLKASNGMNAYRIVKKYGERVGKASVVTTDVNPYFQRPEIRRLVRQKFSQTFQGNWQVQETPAWLVRDMVGQVEDSPELQYCVLFNMEFLEELIFARMIPRDRIMFMADSRHEAKVAMGMYGVKTMRCRKGMKPGDIIRLVEKKVRKAFFEGQEMPKTNNLVVFGNPPYQQQTEAQKKRSGGTEQAKAIYNLFTEAVIDNLNPRYLSFVTPSKWMAGGMYLDNYRQRMMNDRRIRAIKHFKGESEVFQEVTIKGGVSYFLWDREYSGKCNFNGMHRYLDEYDIIVSDNKAVSVLDKVKSIHTHFINERCCTKKAFGITTNFDGWKENGTPCYAIGNVKKFVENGEFSDRNNILKKWKVCTSKAGSINSDSSGKTSYITKIFIVEPNAICTETYTVVNSFETEVEAHNFVVYMKTKFFRFMLSIRLMTHDVNKEKFAFVPDLGDYSKPITDADLYKKFGLTNEEIAHIESKIKPLS